jgi:hypothetical protein
MRPRLGRSNARLWLGALAVAASAACSTTINDVLADPGRYRNSDVSVRGDVTESIGVLGHGFYRLQDGSGAIWVYSRSGLPRKGARVKATGTLRDFATLDSILGSDRVRVPEAVTRGIGSGLLMVESDRSAS